ncbi:MAG: hypothetical protein Q8M77_06885 [Hydrogenophaga sp.]|nr:hypothetical protein [Hydrogenophaga sp.]
MHRSTRLHLVRVVRRVQAGARLCKGLRLVFGNAEHDTRLFLNHHVPDGVQTSGHTWDAGKRVSAVFAEDTPKDWALKQTFSRHAVRLQESFSGRRWGLGISVPSCEQKKRLGLQVMLRG